MPFPKDHGGSKRAHAQQESGSDVCGICGKEVDKEDDHVLGALLGQAESGVKQRGAAPPAPPRPAPPRPALQRRKIIPAAPLRALLVVLPAAKPGGGEAAALRHSAAACAWASAHCPPSLAAACSLV